MIHSPLASGGLFWPGGSGSAWPGLLAGGYGLLAGLLALLAPWEEAGGSATGADRDRTGVRRRTLDPRASVGVTQKSMLVNSVTSPDPASQRRLPWHVV